MLRLFLSNRSHWLIHQLSPTHQRSIAPFLKTLQLKGGELRKGEMAKSHICFYGVTLALVLFSSAFADDVVILTEENFDKEVGQDPDALVEFYASLDMCLQE